MLGIEVSRLESVRTVGRYGNDGDESDVPARASDGWRES